MTGTVRKMNQRAGFTEGMPAPRNPRNPRAEDQRWRSRQPWEPAPIQPDPKFYEKCAGVLVLSLICILSVYTGLPPLYYGILRIASTLVSLGIIMFRILTGSNAKPSVTNQTTSQTNGATTRVITTKAVPTPAATLPPTRLEISLSPSLFWSIYIPLVAIAIAIVGSHIYFKHQTLLLEHKRLDKEIESSKTGKDKAAELQAGTAIAVDKIKATDPLHEGEVPVVVAVKKLKAADPLDEGEVPVVVAVEKLKATDLLDEGEVQGAAPIILGWWGREV